MRDEFERMKGFVESYVPDAMQRGKYPGFSMAVVREGDVVYAEGFGARDVERSLPATPDTLYSIGSITKSFVAMSIMQLAERGKLGLEDPVEGYIPLRIGAPGKPITIHHLLTHSPGIPSLATSTVALQRGIGLDTGVPWGGVDDFYRLVNGAGEEVVDEPGRRFFYFNAGYRMLGHIIQEASGATFDSYVTRNILRPLGMERSTLLKEEYLRDSDRATTYWKKPDGSMEPTEFPYPNVSDIPGFSFVAAAGGVISTVRELTNYLVANMEGGSYKGRQVVGPGFVERMQTIHIERPPNLHGRYGYGYGWGVTPDFLGHKMVSHGGSILVSTAHVAFVPELKLGVAMACNTAGPPYAAIAEGVLASLMGREPEEAVPALGLKRRMERLTGNYETYKGLSRVRVVNRGGLLYLEQKGPFTDACVPLIPEDDLMESGRFYTLTEGVRQPVEFVIRSPDKIDLFIERYRYHRKLA